MRPAVVLLGFVLGSSAAISFALSGTMIVFTVLKSEHPRLNAEIVPLLTNTGLFAVVTLAAAASFYGEIKELKWRRGAQVTLLVVLVVLVGHLTLP